MSPLPHVIVAMTTLALVMSCSAMAPNPPNTLTPEGEKVTPVDRPADVAKCRSLGKVIGRAASVFGKVDLATDQLVDARNKAAKLGANRLVRRGEDQPIAEPGTASFEAFLCD